MKRFSELYYWRYKDLRYALLQDKMKLLKLINSTNSDQEFINAKIKSIDVRIESLDRVMLDALPEVEIAKAESHIILYADEYLSKTKSQSRIKQEPIHKTRPRNKRKRKSRI